MMANSVRRLNDTEHQLAVLFVRALGDRDVGLLERLEKCLLLLAVAVPASPPERGHQ